MFIRKDGKKTVSRPKRTLLFMLLDAVLINIALFGSFYLRFEEGLPASYIPTYTNAALLGTVSLLAAFHLFGLYKNIWRDRKTHKYYKCPGCAAFVRIRKPEKGRRILVTCPKCRQSFEKRT